MPLKRHVIALFVAVVFNTIKEFASSCFLVRCRFPSVNTIKFVRRVFSIFFSISLSPRLLLDVFNAGEIEHKTWFYSCTTNRRQSWAKLGGKIVSLDTIIILVFWLKWNNILNFGKWNISVSTTLGIHEIKYFDLVFEIYTVQSHWEKI